MKIKLICDENKKENYIKKIIEKGFEIVENSKILLVEKGYENKIKNDIYIVFNENNFEKIFELIKIIQNQKIIRNEKFITVKNAENFELIKYEKIQYFVADRNKIFCVVENNKKFYEVKEKLYYLEKTLDSKMFIRVSKSHIVNVLNIKEIVPWFNSKLIIKFKGTNKTVEVTRSYLKDFKKFLGI
ncbi:LytTR family transcriptional regulator [Hypnocyclicus thermotrophus]|uniref:LytTR family transcriptional regulator n=1 Tax=Hypnocyclicus thermotrophus TaxID=1627895 RepID=A0AA46DZQ9_9FUSO|nr:LytTR family DNA-binding domain-containing protein [Hypnocyclicus thermotrophus]TDT71942.1 LytTR family transcriptional regulator [Hypnocyclicus thermotrophus]